MSETTVLATVATLLAALIIGGGTGILERYAGTPLGASIVRGATAFTVATGLASAHAGFGASPLVCVINALFGIVGGLAGLVLMRVDGRPWPGAIMLGGACFGGAVGFAVAVEVMAGAL